MEIKLNTVPRLEVLPSPDPVKLDVALQGMESGWPAIVINDSVVISAKLFLQAAGYIRGTMQKHGLLPTNSNPPLAMIVLEKGWVEFCFEEPLQEFRYDVAEAKKLWRVLRQIAEEANT